jgi:hypothetical protein
MKLSKEELIECLDLAVQAQKLAIENMRALLATQQQFAPALREAHEEISRLQTRINELEGKP